MDNLAEDAWTLWQSPANNCHFMNQNVSTDRGEADESANGLYTKSVTEVAGRKYTLTEKKSFPKRRSESNTISSKNMFSSNQTGIRQKKAGGNTILKEVLIIQGMKMVSVTGSQATETEERRIEKLT